MRKLELMQAELESNQLVTVLAPSKRGLNPWDCVRVNVSENPKWYKRLCAAWSSKRGVRRGKHDTIVRRRETLRALERLIANKPKGGIYEERILELLPTIKI